MEVEPGGDAGRPHEHAAVGKRPFAIHLCGNQVSNACEELLARRDRSKPLHRTDDTLEALGREVAAFDPTAKQGQRGRQEAAPRTVARKRGQVCNKLLDDLSERVEQDCFVLELPLFGRAAGLVEAHAPGIEPRHDARPGGNAIPASRTHARVGAQQIAIRHTCRGQEFCDLCTIQVGIEQVEQQGNACSFREGVPRGFTPRRDAGVLVPGKPGKRVRRRQTLEERLESTRFRGPADEHDARAIFRRQRSRRAPVECLAIDELCRGERRLVAARDTREHAYLVGVWRLRRERLERRRRHLRGRHVAERAECGWRKPRHRYRALQVFGCGRVGHGRRRSLQDDREVDFFRNRQKARTEALARGNAPRELVGQLDVDGEVAGVGEQRPREERAQDVVGHEQVNRQEGVCRAELKDSRLDPGDQHWQHGPRLRFARQVNVHLPGSPGVYPALILNPKRNCTIVRSCQDAAEDCRRRWSSLRCRCARWRSFRPRPTADS